MIIAVTGPKYLSPPIGTLALVDVDALEADMESATHSVVLTFPSTASAYYFDRALRPPSHLSLRLIGSGLQHVELRCGEPMVLIAAPDFDGVELRLDNLLLNGCGVAVESDSQGGVYLSDCVFRGVRSDWSFRGDSGGVQGPSRVSLRRCSFLDGGLEAGGCGALTQDLADALAATSGVGAVWMPMASRDWTLTNCICASYRAPPLRFDGVGLNVVGGSAEALRSSADARGSFVSFNGARDVNVTRFRLGSEACSPSVGLLFGAGLASAAGSAIVSSATVHGLMHGGASNTKDCPDVERPVTVDLQGPVEGFRLSSAQLGPSVSAVARVPGAGTTAVGVQNEIRWVVGELDRSSMPYFVDLAGSRRLGASFDAGDPRARAILARSAWPWKATRNLLRGVDLISPVGGDVLPWRDWHATPSEGWTSFDWMDWPGVSTLQSPPGAPGGLLWLSGVPLTPQDSAGPDAEERSCVLSCWCRAGVGTVVTLRALTGDGIVAQSFVGRGSFDRLWLPFVAPATSPVAVSFQFEGIAEGDALLIAWPQLETGSAVPTAYRRTGSFGPGPEWPSASWAIGPIGVAVHRPCGEPGGVVDISRISPGDRLVGNPLMVAGEHSFRTLVRTEDIPGRFYTARLAGQVNA